MLGGAIPACPAGRNTRPGRADPLPLHAVVSVPDDGRDRGAGPGDVRRGGCCPAASAQSVSAALFGSRAVKAAARPTAGDPRRSDRCQVGDLGPVRRGRAAARLPAFAGADA